MQAQPSPLNDADRTPPPCLLLHGLISTPGEFSGVRTGLQRLDIALHTPELPGYSFAAGLSPCRWQDWLAQARQCLQDQVRQSGQPVVVGGLCIGAILALALAAELPDQVTSLVLLSPTLYYDGWGLSPWRSLRHIGYLPGLRRWISVAEREPYGVKNPQIRKWIVRELQQQACSPAGAAKLPLWAIHEAEKLIRHVSKQLAHITAPSLILHAREDEVTSLRSPELLMKQLASAHKRLVVLENSYHMVTLDNNRHQVIAEMAQWIRHSPVAQPDMAVPGAKPFIAPRPQHPLLEKEIA